MLKSREPRGATSVHGTPTAVRFAPGAAFHSLPPLRRSFFSEKYKKLLAFFIESAIIQIVKESQSQRGWRNVCNQRYD